MVSFVGAGQVRELSAASSEICSSTAGELSLIEVPKVVRDSSANIPVFVLEYLLGKYCATDDTAAIDAGLFSCNGRVG